MFVKSIMIPRHQSFVIQSDDTAEKALSLLEDRQVDGIPVLNGDKYEGMITRYTIYKSFFESNHGKEEFLKNTKVKEIATHQEKFLTGDEVFEATLFDLKDFPLLSVVDEQRKFLGVVTRSDVMDQFQSAFGGNRPGVRIAFTSVETEGRIARLAEIIQQFHESVISLVTFDETDKLVRRIVLKIEKKNNIEKFISKLEKSGFRVLNIHEQQ
ncbi:CBS domain-containing protein [Falsibacillus pallidus]|uniref:CBS domain-containing protein n=1 Tax=Falsibacillus pallidus TaxID=493781 RepID=UPI003D956EDF